MKAKRKLILPQDPRELLACCRAWLEGVAVLADASPGPPALARLMHTQPWLLADLHKQTKRPSQPWARQGLRALMAGSLMALALRHPSARVATDITVTTFVDEDDGLLGGGIGISLREAIRYSLSGDTILLPSGTFTLTIPGANDNVGATGDLDIVAGKALTLTGVMSNTTIINANGLDRALHITGTAALTLSQVTVMGGNVSSVGGGIRNNGHLNLSHSVISGNTANSGGGLFTQDTLTLTNSVISGNIASSKGGGIQSYSGTLNLSNTTISDNQADIGGGLSNDSGALNITDSTFSGNLAGNGPGGGLYDQAGVITLTNSLVSSNIADQNGGGTYNNLGELIVVNSIISGNEATGRGGGLYNYGGTLAITNSVISNNTVSCVYYCSRGGGVANGLGVLTITYSTISGNRAHDGGGVNNGPGNVTIVSSTIASNNGSSGGGVNNGLGSMTIINSTISGHTGAGSGGGIRNRGTLNLVSSTVSGNDAIHGGGISNDYGALTLTNSTVSHNQSIGYGGGLRNDTGVLTLTNSIVSYNVAFQGGGLSSLYGTLTTINSTISGNIATTNGGGLGNYFGTLMMINSTVSGNMATNYGGGWSNYSGLLTILNSTLTGNIADSDENNAGDGGGVSQNGSSPGLILQNTIIAGNFDSSPLTGTVHLDASGVITGNAHNLIGNLMGVSGTLGTGSDIVNPNPGLSPLADNGGDTFTHALISGSPAIDAGDAVICAAPPVNNLDQRGEMRPQGVVCDIGSYEALPEPEIAVFDGLSEILDGSGIVDFGATLVGSPITRTFVISNTGTFSLTLTPPITLPTGFSLASGFTATTLLPGEATLFMLRLDAAVAGVYSGEVLFPNSDADENPFNFFISGTVDLNKLYLPFIRR